MAYHQLGVFLIGLASRLTISQAILCYKCSFTDDLCTVTTSDTPTEDCPGFCLTRIQWKFRETVREVNISRSCVPSCYDRTYLYGYFDSVEDICCGDDLCNSHTKPSGYNKCNYCSGDGEETCQKEDFIQVSPEPESKIFCVGQCAKIVSEGKYDGNTIRSTVRTCEENCEQGTKPLLDPYGDTEIGTIMTYCCEGDLCNTATSLLLYKHFIAVATMVGLVITLLR